MSQPLFLDKVQRLTLLVQKIADLIEGQERLKADLKRESTAFFSYINLALGEKLAVSDKALLSSIGIICGYLKGLRSLPNLKDLNIENLERSYLSIYKKFSETKKCHPVPSIPFQKKEDFSAPLKSDAAGLLPSSKSEIAPSPLTDRQQLILRFAESHKRFQLKELISHFPSLSEKTVRNDLLALCDHGVVKRFGIAPRSYYEVTRHAETDGISAESIIKHAEVLTTV